MVNSFGPFYRKFIIIIRDTLKGMGNEIDPVRRFGASGQVWDCGEFVVEYHVVLWAAVAGLEAEDERNISGM